MNALFPNGVEMRASPREGEFRFDYRGRTLAGRVASFNVEARIADKFIETILKGAFSASLAARDVIALCDHDPAKVLARTKAHTLKLWEDDRGLSFEIGSVPETTFGNDILALVASGNAGGMSFGFTVDPSGERWIGNKRELSRVNLAEISVVSSWPAYEGTNVSARARFSPDHFARRRRILESL